MQLTLFPTASDTSVYDAARGQVVRAVNLATVSAYWHIGREVVEALQQGEERATYGKALIERLAQRLTERYGKGFSATNLWYFRQFYLAYRDRIPYPPGGESQHSAPSGIPHPLGGESLSTFHPNLSWSHYRALMRVADAKARHFYEAVRDVLEFLDLPSTPQFHEASSRMPSSLAFSGSCGN